MSKKWTITLIVFLILAITGISFYLLKSPGEVPTETSTETPATTKPVNNLPADPELTALQSMATTTDPIQIEARIKELTPLIERLSTEKEQQINQTAVNRPFNDDELSFKTRPKVYIINSLVKQGKLSAFDKQILLQKK